LPFVLFLFLTADSYKAALRFILPGVGTTAVVTVAAYLAASLLGLILAAMQSFSMGRHTVLRWLIRAGVLLLASLALFTRPQLDYVLVGTEGGRVAILQGGR